MSLCEQNSQMENGLNTKAKHNKARGINKSRKLIKKIATSCGRNEKNAKF